jgi:hypothetical protein
MKSGFDRIGTIVSLESAKRSCLDKRPYSSRNAARDAAAKNGKKYGRSYRWYRCGLCHQFHLATVKPKGKARAKAGSVKKAA